MPDAKAAMHRNSMFHLNIIITVIWKVFFIGFFLISLLCSPVIETCL